MRNIAVGYLAGVNVDSGNDNILVGIRGVTTDISDGLMLVIDSAGQLGTISSSGRYKEDIQDMGENSSGLMQLRPVTFRYTEANAGNNRPVQPGLIAEEVAEVFPGLVVRASDGEIHSVQYHKLIPCC